MSANGYKILTPYSNRKPAIGEVCSRKLCEERSYCKILYKNAWATTIHGTEIMQFTRVTTDNKFVDLADSNVSNGSDVEFDDFFDEWNIYVYIY